MSERHYVSAIPPARKPPPARPRVRAGPPSVSAAIYVAPLRWQRRTIMVAQSFWNWVPFTSYLRHEESFEGAGREEVGRARRLPREKMLAWAGGACEGSGAWNPASALQLPHQGLQ